MKRPRRTQHLLLLAIVVLCLAPIIGLGLVTAQTQSTWQVQYYNNPNWQGGPALTQTAPYIYFNWGYGSPGPAIPADNFTARMFSDQFFYAGTYRFTVLADDEVALTIDNVLYLDTRNAGQSGKTFTIDIPITQNTHRVQMDYREFVATAYIQLSWVYIKPDGSIPTPTPPPPLPTPTPSQCMPSSAASVQTKFGDYTPCIQQGLHQSKCFQSDGAWDSPNVGSIELEPKIEFWGKCEPADTVKSFQVSCDPKVPYKAYKCSKTLAGWFPN